MGRRKGETVTWKHAHYMPLACVLFAAAVSGGCSTPEPAIAAGPKLPASTVVERVSRSEVGEILQAARGKVLVVNLWATWCPPCVEEMPYFATFYNEYHDKDVAFLPLSVDDPAQIDSNVRRFQQDKGLPFPVRVLVERDLDALGKVLKTPLDGAIPVTLVYDREGKLKQSWEESITLENLKGAVDRLL